MSIHSLIRRGRSRLKLSEEAFASKIGVSRGAVQQWEKEGGTAPSRAHQPHVAKLLGITVAQLVTGDDSVLDVQPAHPISEPRALSRSKSSDSDSLSIPQYDAGGAMGDGLILEDKQPGLIKSWVVDHEWLRLNVRHHTGLANLCIVTGFGPSMQPKYNSGDPLLLDKGVTSVETEGIYFFRVGKHGFIKQLQRIPTEDGMIIRAKSLNSTYDPFDISAKMDFQVFGKVLTVWKSEQV